MHTQYAVENKKTLSPSFRSMHFHMHARTLHGVCVCARVPESEDEKHQQHAECGHIVHGFHQHHQLSPQGRQEANQLKNPQQTKCSQD